MTLVKRRTVAGSLAALTSAMAIAGCGAESDPGAEIVDIASPRNQVAAENGLDKVEPEKALSTALEALNDGGTFHVRGTMRNGSTLDMSYVVGVGATGSVTDPERDAPVEILAIDDKIYVTGDEEFLAESIGEDADKTVAGKWLLLREESPENFDVIADGAQFAETVLARGESVEMTGVRELDGVPVIGLLFEESGATLWVAASGDPVPVQFEEKGASAESGILHFELVDEDDLELKKPDSDDVVKAADGEDDDEDDE